jgi:uncharacterized protein YqgQ
MGLGLGGQGRLRFGSDIKPMLQTFSYSSLVYFGKRKTELKFFEMNLEIMLSSEWSPFFTKNDVKCHLKLEIIGHI